MPATGAAAGTIPVRVPVAEVPAAVCWTPSTDAAAGLVPTCSTPATTGAVVPAVVDAEPRTSASCGVVSSGRVGSSAVSGWSTPSSPPTVPSSGLSSGPAWGPSSGLGAVAGAGQPPAGTG